MEDQESDAEDPRAHLPSPAPPQLTLRLTPSPPPRAEPRLHQDATPATPSPERNARAPAAPVLTAAQPPERQQERPPSRDRGDFAFLQENHESVAWLPPPEPLSTSEVLLDEQMDEGPSCTTPEHGISPPPRSKPAPLLQVLELCVSLSENELDSRVTRQPQLWSFYRFRGRRRFTDRLSLQC